MNRTIIACVTTVCLSLSAAAGLAADKDAKSYYLIGNSLTWDTIPGLMDGDTQWHVDCGKPLPYIAAHPEQPCVETSTLWPQALKEKQYDVISVQPHNGSTLATDVETISNWMKMQPDAVFVIHSGWAFHATRVDEFTNFDLNGTLNHSPTYYRALVAKLRELHPDREIRQTRAINLLEKIAQDVAAGKAPYKEMVELYRDSIHMKYENGRYLMHNAMRHALGQPFSANGFDKVDPKEKEYLDSVLAMLKEEDTDQELLEKTLSVQEGVDRKALIAKISDEDLKAKLTELLPKIEEAAATRRTTQKLEADLKEIGGEAQYEATGPQWLYLIADDRATDVFESLVGVNLYNGNNPLKGRGGKNDLVTEDWLKRIAQFRTIRKLSLANCVLENDWMKHVGTMTNLTDLNLTLTAISDDGLQHLGSLTELRSFGLASAQCTGTGFSYLTGLKKLQNVNFHYTPLNDAGLKEIAKVGVSGRLWFAHTHFTDEGAKVLSTMTGLTSCGIGSKEKESSGEAVAALVNLPLVELSLLDNQADSAGLTHAAKIKTLKKLDASHAPQVEDAAFMAVAELPNLEEFKIGHAKVTDEGLQAFAKCKSLKKLSLSKLKNVTEEGVSNLRKARPELIIEVQ